MTGLSKCPHCGYQGASWLPIEPHFTITDTAALLGVSRGWVEVWLRRHPDVPRLYRKHRYGGKTRLVPARVVRAMRQDIRRHRGGFAKIMRMLEMFEGN
jgi:hypothetical protein